MHCFKLRFYEVLIINFLGLFFHKFIQFKHNYCKNYCENIDETHINAMQDFTINENPSIYLYKFHKCFNHTILMSKFNINS